MSPGSVLTIRLLMLMPLVFVTFQVIMLRQLLRSRAWTMLALGFVTFVAIQTTAMVIRPPLTPALIVMLVGYMLVAAGFYTLRRDLLGILRTASSPDTPRNRRKDDPQVIDQEAP